LFALQPGISAGPHALTPKLPSELALSLKLHAAVMAN